MKNHPFTLIMLTLMACVMAPLTSVAAEYDRANDPHGFTVFMQDGGWCWYQDPRAIAHDGKLFIGSVKGNGSGPALVGIYDFEAEKSLGNVLMQDRFGRDDHNSPVFYVRPDGSVLAIYAKHNRDKFHYYRISDPQDPTQWSEEQVIDHSAVLAKNERVTYMNLYNLSDEGKLYNFYRGFKFNPSFVTSSDDGSTWGDYTHFIESEIQGRHRPYPRYAGNGTDTIYVSFTDGHPRKFGNSIYYCEFRDGKFYKADGTLIKDLKNDGPLRPSESEVVYTGTMTMKKPEGFESVPGSAWTSDFTIDEDGHPHIAYTLYLSNDDHRYRIASWNGEKWIDREVAFGGKCLYTRESSYTGLISLDPKDPSVVFISTDVDPSTGKDTGEKHEIYRAEIGPSDDISTINWKAVTQDSPVRNIRPMIVREGDQRFVLWQRGDFIKYTDYDLDTVGFTEQVAD